MFIACRTAQVEIVKILISAGANIDLEDENYQTALHWGKRTKLCLLKLMVFYLLLKPLDLEIQVLR